MRHTDLKAPVLTAVAFFGTLGILSVGYSAYVSNYPATATAGTSQLSAGEWNKMVTALQTLDTNLSAFTISGGNVGIGTAPNSKLSVNGNIATMGYGIVGKNLGTAPVTGAFIAGNVGSNDGGYGLFYWSNAINGADDRRGNVDIGSYAVGGTPGKINFLSYNGTGWNTNMVIQPNGYVGIGTANPDRKFEVAGQIEATQPVQWGSMDGGFRLKGPTDNSYSVIQFTNNAGNAHWAAITATPAGNVGIGTITPSYTLQVNGSVAGTSWTATSDARMKKDVETLTGALDKISALRGVAFSWDREAHPERNFPEGRQIGFIAQEVEKVIPEVVTEDSKGIKGVEYANVTAELVEAVKELKAKNEVLEREISELKNK